MNTGISNRRRVPHAAARGVATLTVVMLLFFIMAIVAAYTNRNLVFEQRTSINSYRTSQALAAAEAGVDWAIAQLNNGSIDDSCIASAAATDEFRWRYFELRFDGTQSVKQWPSGGKKVKPLPACVMTPSGPSCSCPSGPYSTLPMVDSDAPAVFALIFNDFAYNFKTTQVRHPGAIRLVSRGCTNAHTGATTVGALNDSDASCQRSTGTADVDGSMSVEVTLGLVSALPVPPVAAITAGGSISQSAGTLRATNEDPSTAVALHAGTAITGTTDLRGPAGTSATLAQANDSAIHDLAVPAGTFFQALFGMPAAMYQQQPAAVRVDCGGGCTWTTLAPVLTANPSRVIYLSGNLTLDQSAVIGSATLPAMLVVSGDVTISAPVSLSGVIYGEGNITWQSGAASGLIRGALVARGDFVGEGNAAIAYDADIIRRIRQAYGSYVRVPGSWRLNT